jgi:hypothetical protein
MTVGITTSGTWAKTDAFLSKMSKADIFDSLGQEAQRGVAALEAATPAGTGASAASWSYEVEKDGGTYTIYWTNSHVDEDGTPIVIMLQYGHGTGTGGYVAGRDFINPAIAPIFDQIADTVWKVVESS